MAFIPITLCSDGLAVIIHDPSVLIEGVLFRARYLGSTQLVCEGQPTKATRMMQAEEAVARIKVSISAREYDHPFMLPVEILSLAIGCTRETFDASCLLLVLHDLFGRIERKVIDRRTICAMSTCCNFI